MYYEYNKRIAFFHQNEVIGRQGGIERFLDTLMQCTVKGSVLITESTNGVGHARIALRLSTFTFFPKWFRFVIAVLSNLKEIKSYLKTNKIDILEFSRPEYVLFALFLPGRKIFTFHGAGPLATELFKWLVHYSCCWFLLFYADRLQIVGRDNRGIPRCLYPIIKSKIRYINAWYDDVFQTSSFPDTTGCLRIFYAGRLAKAKNPDLLYKLIRSSALSSGDRYKFVYFGADAGLIPSDLVGVIESHGLQNADGVAKIISSCHFGILTSHTEGSPFIVVEALACGRGFVLPPLEGLKQVYKNNPGIIFSKSYDVSDFNNAIDFIADGIKSGNITDVDISNSVNKRSKTECTKGILSWLYEVK